MSIRNLKININNNNNEYKNINMLNRSNIIRLLNEKINNKEILQLAITIYNKLENNEEISTDILINMLKSKKKFNNPFNNWSSNNEFTTTNNNSNYVTNNSFGSLNRVSKRTRINNNSPFNSKKTIFNTNNTNENNISISPNSKLNINNYIFKSRKPIETNIKTVVREVVRDHPIFYEIYHSSDLFFKLYQFNDYMNYVNFILEVTFQIYSYYILQEKLEVGNVILTTPKILKCYKTNKFNNLEFIEFRGSLSYEYIFYIEMESAEGNTLRSISPLLKNNNCRLFVNIIEYLDGLLKMHSIFHNDLNRDNIFIKRLSNDGKITKITIIDFGQSLDKPHIDPRAQYKYKCNNKKGVILQNVNLL